LIQCLHGRWSQEAVVEKGTVGHILAEEFKQQGASAIEGPVLSYPDFHSED
jgi:hypothetical protein